ncbi:MAG: alkaline phosphatase family protein [Ktedonobacterales bacterium]
MGLRGRIGRRGTLAGATALLGVSLVMLLVAAIGAQPAAARASQNDGNRSQIKNFQHVFIIMMENTGFDSLIGNPNAPWINAAAAQYGVATNYYGVTHPSQPNYIAATSGSTNGVTADTSTNVDAPNIVDQMEAHGKTWKAYMQSYAPCIATPLVDSCGNQLYERKHNPFISYVDVQSNPARVANIVDLSQFSTDLAGNSVPDYSWISPDQCHDMHGRGAPASDPCSFSNEQQLIATGDTFLQQTVGAIMSSRAWNGNSVIFIQWDESDFTGTGPAGFGDTRGCCDSNPGGGLVLSLVISHSDHSARSSAVAYNHFSMLATIEDGWKLGCLAFTCDTTNVPPMSDLVGPKG